MKTGILIQARMSSERFPGKVLHEVNNKPMLQYLLERLEHGSHGLPLVVATSSEPSDAPILEFCTALGVTCFRGSLGDVAGRFREAAERYGFEAFVRVSGDSPLLDPTLVELAVRTFLEKGGDLVTNVQERTFPKGQSVEVVRKSSFDRACACMTEPADREHVTRYLYLHPESFVIHNLRFEEPCGEVHLSVDTPEDMDRFRRMVLSMERPHWEYDLRDALQLFRNVCEA
ncbi:MAG: NTP transferase domain-containing protein [Thermodesulfobacteriota bacterium]